MNATLIDNICEPTARYTGSAQKSHHMSYQSYNYFRRGTRKEDVEEFLLLLGYERFEPDKWSLLPQEGNSFSYFREKDYESATGVYAEVSESEPGRPKVYTRTNVGRSKFDGDFQNHTIRQLKARFGGYFETDSGRNKLFSFDGVGRKEAEGGCYLAYSNFRANVMQAALFLSSVKGMAETAPPKGISWLDSYNPSVISSNLLVPFLIAILEDYFRSSYVALLQYSPRRLSVFGKVRLPAEDLLAVSNGIMSIDAAAARWMSFQDLNKIQQSFKELDNGIDIAGVLRKPDSESQGDLFEAIEKLISRRHLLIHQSTIDATFDVQAADTAVKTIEKAVQKTYELLKGTYGWSQD
jgi:hypothetical protein